MKHYATPQMSIVVMEDQDVLTLSATISKAEYGTNNQYGIEVSWL